MEETPLTLPPGRLAESQASRRIPVKWLIMGALTIVLLIWLNNTPAGLIGKADAVGYAVCHRIDARSFHLGERQMPLCARCSGMYLGVVLGLVYLAVVAPRAGGMPSRSVLVVLAGLGLFFAVDGINSYLHLFPNAPALYEPNNTLRLLSGTGVGLAIAAVVYPAFNQTAWRVWRPQPALGGLRSLALLVLLGLAVDVLVLSENSLILYPLALISAAGVLLLLSLVYGMVLMMVFRLENRLQRLADLLLPLSAGLLMAILQIGLIDLGRYLLTGTWEGFHLG